MEVSCGGEALWWTFPPAEADGLTQLCVSRDDGETSWRVVRGLHASPKSMAAHGEVLWLIPAQRDAPSPLLHLRAQWSDELGMMTLSPVNGFDRTALVPSSSLELIIASPTGPMVIDQEKNGQRSSWKLERGNWVPLPVTTASTGEHVIAGVVSGADVLLLCTEGNTSATLRRLRAGGWSEWDLGDGQFTDLVAYEDAILLGTQQAGNTRTIQAIQNQSLTDWMSVPDCEPSDRLIATESGLWMLRLGDDSASIRRLDLLDTTAGPWTPLSPASPISSEFFTMLAQIGLILAVVLVILFGGLHRPLSPPSDCVPAPMGKRTLAALVDLIPGVLVAWWTTGLHLDPMSWLTCAGPSPMDQPTLFAIGSVTAVWAGGWEWACGRSLGKWLTGLTVISMRGPNVKGWQVVIRSLGKAVTIMVPLLAIWVLLTPWSQTVGDVAAGTGVGIKRSA